MSARLTTVVTYALCYFIYVNHILDNNTHVINLINQRIVVDYMKSNDYKLFNITLTNELIMSVRDAHHKYTEDLLSGKKKELLQEKDKKKSINENIMTLNQRKTLLVLALYCFALAILFLISECSAACLIGKVTLRK